MKLSRPAAFSGAVLAAACVVAVFAFAYFRAASPVVERSHEHLHHGHPRASHSPANSLPAAADQQLDEWPVSSTAKLESSLGGVVELEALDGEFVRVVAEPGESFDVALQPLRFSRNRPVTVEANHGGTLNRRIGPMDMLEFDGNGLIAFSYSVGGHRGRYTVEVSQGAERELFEFWVGPEPTAGDPGPARTYSAPSQRSQS